MESGAKPRIDPARVLSFNFPQVQFNYTERDVALYALGVGAPGADPCNATELPFVYHPEGQSSIKVLPTFAVLFPNGFVEVLQEVPGLHYDPALLLHGEQYVELYCSLPTKANIRSSIRISGLHDKGKAAIVELEVLSRNENTGENLCMNRITIFLRGAGGFSTLGKPYSYVDRKSSFSPGTGAKTPAKRDVLASGTPHVVFEDRTHSSQALLYRLSGDYNPLHSDPSYAESAGFPRPILHGLCTLGYATRAIISSFCGGDPTMVQSMQGRFLVHVFPGETLVTEMWSDDSQTRQLGTDHREEGQIEHQMLKYLWKHLLFLTLVSTWRLWFSSQGDLLLLLTKSVHYRVHFKLTVKERGQVALSGSITLHPSNSRL